MLTFTKYISRLSVGVPTQVFDTCATALSNNYNEMKSENVTRVKAIRLPWWGRYPPACGRHSASSVTPSRVAALTKQLQDHT